MTSTWLRSSPTAAAAAFFLGYAAAAAAPPPEQGALGEEIYMDYCAMCHEPDGAGIPDVAPPLIANPRVEDAAYLEKVIREGLAGPLEFEGVRIEFDDEMPPFDDLTDAEIESAVAFVLSAFVSSPGIAPVATTAPEPITPGATEIGKDLFLGRQPLQNGGPACIACHTAGTHGNLGGHGLGPDLTDLYSRFVERTATAVRNAPSPVMRPVYGDKPVTDEETGHLLAFFIHAAEQEQADGFDGLLGLGLAGALLLFGVMALMPSRTRESYVRRLRSKP